MEARSGSKPNHRDLAPFHDECAGVHTPQDACDVQFAQVTRA